MIEFLAGVAVGAVLVAPLVYIGYYVFNEWLYDRSDRATSRENISRLSEITREVAKLNGQIHDRRR